VPSIGDQVTIADGHTVTVDTGANCYGLTVGQGASGVLRFEATSARTLTVGSDVLIAAGAVLGSALSGTQSGHVLSLAGSLTNQGTLDLSTNGDLAGAAVAFTGGANASFTGNGSVTNVRAITIAKSTGAVVTLNPASF